MPLKTEDTAEEVVAHDRPRPRRRPAETRAFHSAFMHLRRISKRAFVMMERPDTSDRDVCQLSGVILEAIKAEAKLCALYRRGHAGRGSTPPL
jgi:hypothetical protein